jgi:glycerol-1-phosphate dehydrogenase [NAD(P)+]
LSLPNLLGKTLPCTCGVPHTVPTQAVVLVSGALQQLAACCAQYVSGRQVLVVDDATTHQVAGARVVELLRQADYRVATLTLPTPLTGHVVANDDTVAVVKAAIRPGVDFLVAVGSGTVNDVTKLASFQAQVPYVVCPTALSMNGYTSAIAAILSKGVKRTIPACPAVAVVADLDVLSTAPAIMTQAGLGDMLSKPVSTADWQLAHLIKGEYYCQVPQRLVERAERACRHAAVAIGHGAAAGLQALAEALLLSGISMVVAGSSSPASGGEHLLSHYWDMTAAWYGRQEQLHGAQVGVATLVTATLYEKLRQLDPTAIDVAQLRRAYVDWPAYEHTMRRIHGPLADEIVTEARKKYLPLAQKEQEWVFIRDHWPQLWAALDAILLPASALREVLRAAGAPTTIRELGISVVELRNAFLYARDIRGRYTVLDFAQDLGVLERLCDDVLAQSGVLA